MSAALPVHPTFEWPVRVYWEDTDAGGIVFYANYLKFFERARTEWLRSLGVEQRALLDATGGIFVVAEANLRYHRPARLDDALLVTTSVHEIGRASLTMLQQVFLNAANSPQLLCEGSIRVAWVDGSTLKPAKIPQNILKMLK